MTQSVDTEVSPLVAAPVGWRINPDREVIAGATDDLNVDFSQVQWMGQIAKSFH